MNEVKSTLSVKGRKGARRIVVFAPSPALELDITGPINVFSAANKIKGGTKSYEILVASSGEDRCVTGMAGLSMVAHTWYRDVSDDVDTLLVAGGRGAMVDNSPSIIAWLKEMASSVRRVGSICTGAFLLAQAGILDGKRATTHWTYAQNLATRFPGVNVDANPIWIQDGNIYTSAGVTAGMDLALGLVEEDLGSKVALDVARRLVLFLRRPGGQAQFSVSLSTQTSSRNPLFDLQVWMVDNLRENLSVEALASRVAMSPRNFSRLFVREFGIPPAQYVTKIRIEAARQMLEHSGAAGVEEIARECGFQSAELMRRAFIRMLGVAPRQYRERFGSGTEA